MNGPLDKNALRVCVYADTPDADPRLAALTLDAHLAKLEGEGRVRHEDGRITLTKGTRGDA